MPGTLNRVKSLKGLTIRGSCPSGQEKSPALFVTEGNDRRTGTRRAEGRAGPRLFAWIRYTGRAFHVDKKAANGPAGGAFSPDPDQHAWLEERCRAGRAASPGGRPRRAGSRGHRLDGGRLRPVCPPDRYRHDAALPVPGRFRRDLSVSRRPRRRGGRAPRRRIPRGRGRIVVFQPRAGASGASGSSCEPRRPRVVETQPVRGGGRRGPLGALVVFHSGPADRLRDRGGDFLEEGGPARARGARAGRRRDPFPRDRVAREVAGRDEHPRALEMLPRRVRAGPGGRGRRTFPAPRHGHGRP